MLRSDREVALDQVTESCKKTADEYAALAEMTENEALSADFSERAEVCRGRARECEDAVRRLGNLPTGPDPDRETMETLGARLRSALSRNGEQVLREKGRELEVELAEKAQAALEHEYPSAVTELLRRVADEARRAADRIGQPPAARE